MDKKLELPLVENEGNPDEPSTSARKNAFSQHENRSGSPSSNQMPDRMSSQDSLIDGSPLRLHRAVVMVQESNLSIYPYVDEENTESEESNDVQTLFFNPKH